MGCFAINIQLFVAAQDYVLEAGGTVTAKTLSLPTTLQGFLVLMTVFFIVLTLGKTFDELTEDGEKD